MSGAGGTNNTDPEGSIGLGAQVFAQTKATFSARDFANFLQMGGMGMDEETADEFLSDLVDEGKLRQIGPGIYAAQVTGNLNAGALNLG